MGQCFPHVEVTRYFRNFIVFCYNHEERTRKFGLGFHSAIIVVPDAKGFERSSKFANAGIHIMDREMTVDGLRFHRAFLLEE